MARNKHSAIIQHVLKNLNTYSACDINIAVNPEPSSSFFLLDERGKSAPIFLPSGGAITGEFLVAGKYESISMAIVSKILTQSRNEFIFVDVGANIGLISRQIMKFSPLELYCYEANPKVFEFLSKNLNAEQPNIQLMNGALWKQESEIDFNDTVDIDGYGSINSEFFKDSIRINKQTNITKIKSYDVKTESEKWRQSGKPIIYKSDIQGMDLDLLDYIVNCGIADFHCVVIEISNNEYEHIFDKLRKYLTVNNKSIVIAPDQTIYRLTESSSMESLSKRNYKYLDLISLKLFETSPWYHSLPSL